MSFAKEVWDRLSAINVNDFTEKKGNLTYLSWSWAWATLMGHYPESWFQFEEPVVYPDSTVEIRVKVCVQDGEKRLHREMWLPVMDNRNNAIPNPDARRINDTKMRCLTKCLALFGCGLYIYSGDDLPKVEQDSVREKQEKLEAVAKYIKDAIERDDDLAVLEAWQELTEEEMKLIWVAETKGGYFSQSEKQYIRAAKHNAFKGAEEAA